MGKLDGKVAIVCGATSGMGRASAKLFAKEGAKIIVVGRGNERSVQRGTQVIAEIKEAGGEATYIPCDTTKEEQVVELIKKTIETYGKINILYNVVGEGKSRPLDIDTVESWRHTFETNLLSCFLTIKYAMPYLLETKGCIINTASVAGLLPILRNNYSYGACNAGVCQFTKILAKDYIDRGVRVNAIAPGVIDTGIWELAPKGWLEQMVESTPIKRIGQPEEIAAAALFLASDEASFVTGQVLAVDGAQSLGTAY